MTMMQVIGVDRGAAWTRIAAGDRDGLLHEPVKRRTGEEPLPTLLREVMEEQGIRPGDVAGIGIGTAGVVDPAEKRVRTAANLPPLDAGGVEDELGLPVVLENDAVAGVVGERLYGDGGDVDNLVHVTIGSGIGAGVYYDGRLLRSTKRGGPAEAGFFVVDYSGSAQNMGRNGVWEAYCSGENLPAFIETLLEGEERATALADFERVTPELLFDHASDGDAVAKDCLERIGRINAAGLATVVNAFAPELVTIGGTVAMEHPEFMQRVIDIAAAHLEEHAVNPVPDIQLTELGGDIGLYGAVGLACMDAE